MFNIVCESFSFHLYLFLQRGTKKKGVTKTPSKPMKFAKKDEDDTTGKPYSCERKNKSCFKIISFFMLFSSFVVC